MGDQLINQVSQSKGHLKGCEDMDESGKKTAHRSVQTEAILSTAKSHGTLLRREVMQSYLGFKGKKYTEMLPLCALSLSSCPSKSSFITKRVPGYFMFACVSPINFFDLPEELRVICK